MAQNREIGELGQIVTVDTSANSLTVNGSIILGNSSSNVVINSTAISVGGITQTDRSFTWTNTHTFTNTVSIAALSANGTLGLSSQVLTTNGSGIYWSSAGVNTNATYTWSNAHTFNGVVTFAQTAVGTVNNALYLNGTDLSTLQGQITSNASAAYTNAVSYTDGKILTANSAITGNAATAYSNAVSYVDGKSYVNTSQLSSNLSNYQTTAGLNANIASYLPTYTGTVNASLVTTDTFWANTTAVSVGNSTSNVVVGANNVTLPANGYVLFGQSNNIGWAEGKLAYDGFDKAITFFNDQSDFYLPIGQKEFVRCYNNSGGTISRGKPVYITGVHVASHPFHSHHPTIALADASDSVKYQVLGMAGHDIASGSHGSIITRGWVSNVDTSSLTASNKVYLGFSAPGVIQSTPPEYPNYPIELGVCLVSSATAGVIYVKIDDNALSRLRVINDVHVGGDLTVDGDLNVTGNVVTTSTTNLKVSDNLIYLASGDTIANTTFTGTGLNDGVLHGVFEGTSSTTYYVKIDTAGATDKFTWSKDNFVTNVASNVAITGAYQTLDNGISIQFQATTGHTVGDKWTGTAAPVNVDLGWAGNYNDGTYHHAGMFRDASDGFFKVFDSYVPEPSANVNIDTTNTTFHIANFQANTMYVGNTSVYATVNSTVYSGTSNNATNLGGTAAASYQLNSTLNANIASYLPTYTGVVNGSSFTVSTLTIANSTGVYTGVVNAASYTVGTSTIANSSGVYTGIVNASTLSVGTAFTANATIVNAVSFYAGTTLIGNTTGPYGKTEISLNVNSALTANNSTNLGGTAAASYQLNSTLNANIASYLPTYTGVVNGSSLSVGTSTVSNSTGLWTTGTVNAATVQVGTSVVANSSRLVIGTAVGLQANGGIGTSGQVLTSNATTVYWATPAASGVTSVATGNGLTGGTITTTGTVSVLANNGITANSTGLFVTQGTGAVVNATGVHVNSTYIGTLTANNATYAFGLSSASTTATASTVVTRDSNGDFTGRYINSSYFNSSDDVSAGSITYLMGKFGDNYYRSATAAKVATFISGQTMNISGSATSATTATTATNLSGGSVAATSGTFSSDLALTTVPFFLNCQTVASNYTISGSYNAHSTGPITINTGVTVTVSTGATWVVL